MIIRLLFEYFTGKVVIDAFRLINPNMMVLGQEPRQTTSNLGHLQKPSVQVSNIDNDTLMGNVTCTSTMYCMININTFSSCKINYISSQSLRLSRLTGE